MLRAFIVGYLSIHVGKSCKNRVSKANGHSRRQVQTKECVISWLVEHTESSNVPLRQGEAIHGSKDIQGSEHDMCILNGSCISVAKAKEH